ncbi:hypothetical protein HZB06_03205 [Candidatus Wolfebacteria bacterium]|nr:hypothetical protein [Candidatus Wolfebacteria bacterium]
MNRKKLKKKIGELPVNLSIVGLALLFGLAERGGVLISEIIQGPNRGLGRSMRRISETKNFWDHYSELKNLHENSARTILWRLEKKGLVEKSTAQKQRRYQLTTRGLRIIKTFQEKKEETWDGKWRIVMFDIPEKKRLDRSWLRFRLVALDFRPIQKSVFLGQQPIEKELYREIMDRKIDHHIRLMTVGEMDNEEFDEFDV